MLSHILTSSPQDGQAPGSGFAFLSTPDVLDMSFCSFTGLVPDFMFPRRSDEQAAVFAQVRLAELLGHMQFILQPLLGCS